MSSVMTDPDFLELLVAVREQEDQLIERIRLSAGDLRPQTTTVHLRALVEQLEGIQDTIAQLRDTTMTSGLAGLRAVAKATEHTFRVSGKTHHAEGAALVLREIRRAQESRVAANPSR